MQRQIMDMRLTVLAIGVSHAAVVAALPLHHRDPFDRMLIAQAIVETMPIISRDGSFDVYPISRVW
ncbi:MAG: type II toxin-antitoxin system VapC family toxin [Thermoguttaceae bacterium]|nr:type II toxin-antitoxin system VapC family toxin [Thermoguttaceae bacterium]